MTTTTPLPQELQQSIDATVHTEHAIGRTDPDVQKMLKNGVSDDEYKTFLAYESILNAVEDIYNGKPVSPLDIDDTAVAGAARWSGQTEEYVNDVVENVLYQLTPSQDKS